MPERPRLVFLGVGALGSNAVVLCRNLDAELVLVDLDRVESKNLLAQAYVKQSVGKHKAEALKLQLLNFWGVKAQAHAVRVTEANVAALTAGAALVVDAFDNAASRRLVSAHARAAGVPLLHAAISADGTFGLVRWDERFTPDEEATPGQPTCQGGEHLAMVGQVAAALARAIQDFLERQQRRDVMVSLGAIQPT